MVENGGTGPKADRNKGGKNGRTPAEARRQRLAASLRSNLRRRKDQDRSRAQPEDAAGESVGDTASSDRLDGTDA